MSETRRSPKDINEAILILTQSWKTDNETLNSVLKETEDDFAAMCQSFYLSGGVGMHIRNGFKLWDKTSPLSRGFIEMNISHPDEMSDYLIRKAYKNVRNECLNEKENI